jgi:hypothetical protein
VITQQTKSIEHPSSYIRHPTRAAIESLAARFGLPNSPEMQDWEYEVADPSRIDEFLSTLEGEALSEDERYTLAIIVMESFNDLASAQPDIEGSESWRRFVEYIGKNRQLDVATIQYYAMEDTPLEDAFDITPAVRPLWARMKAILNRMEEPI